MERRRPARALGRTIGAGFTASAVAALAWACSSSNSGPVDSGLVEDGQAGDGTVAEASSREGGPAEASPGDASNVVTPDASDARAPDGSDALAPDASDAPAGDASDASLSDALGGDAQEGGEAGPEAGVPTLWLGGNIVIEGITSDNYVIYQEQTSSTYYARSLAGGAPTALYTVPPAMTGSYDQVIGQTVFIYGWSGEYTGTLTSWSSGASQPGTLSMSGGLAYLYQTAWAADDGPTIAYLEGQTYPASNHYGARSDGTGKTLLAANIDANFADVSCFPRLAFRGGYAVASFCMLVDGGSIPVIESFSIADNWAPAVIVTNWVDQYRFNIENVDPSVFAFGVDPDGGRVIAASSTSADASLQIFPIDGGPGSVLDPTWQLNPNLSFAGTKVNPWSIVYNDDAGVLHGTPAANPAPRILVDGGVNYLDAFSRDGKWMLTSNQTHPVSYFADLSVVSTVTPGQSQVIATTAQYGNLPLVSSGYLNRAFTTDEQYALFYTNVTPNSNGNNSFYVRSATVTAPLTVQLLSTGWATDASPMAGSKVAVMDNTQAPDGGNVTFDLHIADPSSSAPPTLVASGLPGTYYVSPDGSRVLYTVSGTGAGIYQYVLP